MIERQMQDVARVLSTQYPVLTVLGPRQSGKSTFVTTVFPEYSYVSLETPRDRELAQNDPAGFFNKYQPPLIIDEVQRVPALLSEIQTRVDTLGTNSQYILTGSHQLLLMESVSQSLAGRTSILILLPLSLIELHRAGVSYDLDEALFYGGYPRIVDQSLDPHQWLTQYIRTYVERDVRQLAALKDLDSFQRFIALCAGRVGQLLNIESLAGDAGVTGPTAKAWINLLEASFLVYRLRPHYRNFGKRLIKSPKLYFYDTGLLCALLKISSLSYLESHPLRGAIFENMICSELLKSAHNSGKDPSLYFWRDARGREVDFVLDRGSYLYPIEVKAGASFQRTYLQHLEYLRNLQEFDHTDLGMLVYGGAESYVTQGYHICPWNELPTRLMQQS